MMKNNLKLEGYERLRLFKEDVSTGEVIELGLYDYEIVDRKQEAALKKSRKEHLDRRDAAAARSESPFIWVNCKLSVRLMEDLPTPHVSMLFYLATYCGYEGYIKSGRHAITKSELPQLLQVSEATSRRFFNAVVSAGIIREDEDGKIFLNEDYFRKGKLTTQDMKKKTERGITVKKMNVDSVRELYERATTKSRSTLAYLFLVMPFVNLEYNIVCWDPTELDLDTVHPMSLPEMCEAVGYDASHATRLLRALSDLTLTVVEYDKENKCPLKKENHVIERITTKSNGQEVHYIVINPSVYYSGTDWGTVKILGKFS